MPIRLLICLIVSTNGFLFDAMVNNKNPNTCTSISFICPPMCLVRSTSGCTCNCGNMDPSHPEKFGNNINNNPANPMSNIGSACKNDWMNCKSPCAASIDARTGCVECRCPHQSTMTVQTTVQSQQTQPKNQSQTMISHVQSSTLAPSITTTKPPQTTSKQPQTTNKPPQTTSKQQTTSPTHPTTTKPQMLSSTYNSQMTSSTGQVSVSPNNNGQGQTTSGGQGKTTALQTASTTAPSCQAAILCILSCVNGFNIGSVAGPDGCPVCSCKSSTLPQPVSTSLPGMIVVQSTYGQTASQKPITVNLPIHYTTPHTDLTTTSTTPSTTLKKVVCPGIFNCSKTCYTGFKLDNIGCPLCECAPLPTNLPLGYYLCPQHVECPPGCTKIDERGCKICACGVAMFHPGGYYGMPGGMMAGGFGGFHPGTLGGGSMFGSIQGASHGSTNTAEKPLKQCPGTMLCMMTCKGHYTLGKVGSNGCRTCTCPTHHETHIQTVQKPVQVVQVQTYVQTHKADCTGTKLCMMTCHTRYVLGAKGSDGCNSCSCLPEPTPAPTPAPTKSCMSTVLCMLSCKTGYSLGAAGSDGCQSCTCLAPPTQPPTTPAPTTLTCTHTIECMLTCKEGYTLGATGPDGCPKCSCVIPQKVQVVTVLTCSQHLSCSSGCNVGYKCGNDGCPTCECIKPHVVGLQVVEVIQKPVACTTSFSCPRSCELGYKCGTDGCPTCECLVAVQTVIQPSVTSEHCHNCDNGHQTLVQTVPNTEQCHDCDTGQQQIAQTNVVQSHSGNCHECNQNGVTGMAVGPGSGSGMQSPFTSGTTNTGFGSGSGMQSPFTSGTTNTGFGSGSGMQSPFKPSTTNTGFGSGSGMQSPFQPGTTNTGPTNGSGSQNFGSGAGMQSPFKPTGSGTGMTSSFGAGTSSSGSAYGPGVFSGNAASGQGAGMTSPFNTGSQTNIGQNSYTSSSSGMSSTFSSTAQTTGGTNTGTASGAGMTSPFNIGSSQNSNTGTSSGMTSPFSSASQTNGGSSSGSGMTSPFSSGSNPSSGTGSQLPQFLQGSSGIDSHQTDAGTIGVSGYQTGIFMTSGSSGSASGTLIQSSAGGPGGTLSQTESGGSGGPLTQIKPYGNNISQTKPDNSGNLNLSAGGSVGFGNTSNPFVAGGFGIFTNDGFKPSPFMQAAGGNGAMGPFAGAVGNNSGSGGPFSSVGSSNGGFSPNLSGGNSENSGGNSGSLPNPFQTGSSSSSTSINGGIQSLGSININGYHGSANNGEAATSGGINAMQSGSGGPFSTVTGQGTGGGGNGGSLSNPFQSSLSSGLGSSTGGLQSLGSINVNGYQGPTNSGPSSGGSGSIQGGSAIMQNGPMSSLGGGFGNINTQIGGGQMPSFGGAGGSNGQFGGMKPGVGGSGNPLSHIPTGYGGSTGGGGIMDGGIGGSVGIGNSGGKLDAQTILKKCPETMRCVTTCPLGYKLGGASGNGCPKCTCLGKPGEVMTGLPHQNQIQGLGQLSADNKKYTGQHQDAFPMTCPTTFTCQRTCRHGYKRGQDGCPTCLCHKPNQDNTAPLTATPPIQCMGTFACPKECETAYKCGEDGCPKCDCVEVQKPVAVVVQPQPKPTPQPEKINTVAILKQCPTTFNCMTSCTEGYTLGGADAHGCPSCTCAKIQTECHECEHHETAVAVKTCDATITCMTSCEHGYTLGNKGPDGCPTCKCEDSCTKCTEEVHPVVIQTKPVAVQTTNECHECGTSVYYLDCYTTTTTEIYTGGTGTGTLVAVSSGGNGSSGSFGGGSAGSSGGGSAGSSGGGMGSSYAGGSGAGGMISAGGGGSAMAGGQQCKPLPPNCHPHCIKYDVAHCRLCMCESEPMHG